MDTIGYMYIAYLIIWALAFALIFNMWSSSHKMEKELEAIKVLIQDLDIE
jgi:uncharacterized membrane protein